VVAVEDQLQNKRDSNKIISFLAVLQDSCWPFSLPFLCFSFPALLVPGRLTSAFIPMWVRALLHTVHCEYCSKLHPLQRPHVLLH